MNTILKDLILFINISNVGNLIYRKDIMKLNFRSTSTIDNYRNYLTQANYLKTERPGVYRIIKQIPLDMTYGQLVKEAYPNSEWTQTY